MHITKFTCIILYLNVVSYKPKSSYNSQYSYLLTQLAASYLYENKKIKFVLWISFMFYNSTIFALVIAALQSSRISMFLPNYSKAILSSRRILQLLDTQPIIDSYSTKGLKPVSGDIVTCPYKHIAACICTLHVCKYCMYAWVVCVCVCVCACVCVCVRVCIHIHSYVHNWRYLPNYWNNWSGRVAEKTSHVVSSDLLHWQWKPYQSNKYHTTYH